MNTMTPEESALYHERGYLMCPKCGGKMRKTEFNTLIQGWDEAMRNAVKVQYTGDRSKPTHTIEQPPSYKPSEMMIIGAPAVACRRCNILKIDADITKAVEWASAHLIPSRGRETVPWEVVKNALAEQHT